MNAQHETLNGHEQTTAISALLYYALHIAHPEATIPVLEKIAPNPKRPWGELVMEAREQFVRTLAEGARS